MPSVISSSYSNKKIIVADNASDDDSIAFTKENFTTVEIIEFKKNFGYAKGYNEALKQVNADYCVLLNSDVEVPENWIEPVIELMESDKKIAACQPKILSFHNREYFEYAGAAGGWIDKLGYPFARGRVFDICEKDIGQYDDNAEVFWASGAAMFVRTNVFKELNGFDEFFFAHMEEIDLCWRMQLKGYKIMCCGKSAVYHLGGGTLPKSNIRKVYLNFRNNLLMLIKNLTREEKVAKLSLRFCLDTLFALKNVFTNFSASRAVVSAYSDVLRLSRNKSMSNSQIESKKKMSSLTGVAKKLIVWEYFIKRKKYFCQIVNKNDA